MNAKDIIALLAVGKQPLVQFTASPDVDCFAEAGMIAKVTLGKGPDKHDVFVLTMDFSVAREQNLRLQSHEWFIGRDCSKRGTIFEAGLMKDDLVEEIYFDEGVPFELVSEAHGDPLGDYMRYLDLISEDKKKPMTYVEWLEDQFRSLSHACRR